MISKGRRPQNIKSGISQQPLIGLYSNFKLKLRRPNHILQILIMKTTSNVRRPEVQRWQQNCVECDWWGGKLEENSEEILSGALLSPACMFYNHGWIFCLSILTISYVLIFSRYRSVDRFVKRNNNPEIFKDHAVRRKYLSLKCRLAKRKISYLGLG